MPQFEWMLGYAWLSQLVRSIDFTIVMDWLVDTKSLVFFTKGCLDGSWHWLQMFGVARACHVVCRVFCKMITELDDCGKGIHCNLVLLVEYARVRTTWSFTM
jgi:hypothetical protein